MVSELEQAEAEAKARLAEIEAEIATRRKLKAEVSEIMTKTIADIDISARLRMLPRSRHML